MKKILALILAAVMLFSLAACRKDDTPAPDTDLTETNDAENPEEERAKKAALLLEELRSRPLYTEVETIENDRCYVIRGYFSGTPDGVTDDIFVVYKYGGTRDITSLVYQYLDSVDNIVFSLEKDYVLTVTGRVLSEDKENYTDSTVRFNIYSYEKEDTNVPGESTDLPEESKKLIRSMLRWDDPGELYNRYVDRLVYVPDTFPVKASEYMENYTKIEEESEHDRPALLWYLAREMDLTRKDFERYFAAFDSLRTDYDNSDKVPEIIYDGLMADTLEESMQLLKSEYAFYNDGKLYTINEIGEMYENGTLPFDITDSAYDEVWKNISSYFEMQKYRDLPRDVYLLVRERAHDPVKRIYFWHSGQYGYNMASSYSLGSGSNYFSILECNSYEASVGSMNERYAPIIDGTVFIYDYLNGEKVCDIPISPDGCHIDFIEYSSEDFPRYLTVTPNFRTPDHNTRLYDIEKQEFILDGPFASCVIPKGTDLLCRTVESDEKYITTAYRVGTLEEVLSVEGMIYSAEIEGKTVLTVTERNAWSKGVLAFYDTDGNELSGLDEYKTGFEVAPRFDHIIYYNNK